MYAPPDRLLRAPLPVRCTDLHHAGMSELPKIKVTRNGPYIVTGEVEYVDADGTVVKTLAKAALCRCGHSQSKPFCDGSHREVGFEADTIRAE